MKVALSQAQLFYEVGLKEPAFDLSSSALPAVKTIYAAFASRFSLTPADISVANATRLSDWAIRLSLFAGHWLIDFRFSGYQVTCNLLQTPEDVNLAVECIDLTEEVAQKIIPSFSQKEVLARLSAWYRCDGGAKAASRHLERFAPTSTGIGPGFEGAEEVRFNIAGEFTHSAERWSTRFLIEPSQLQHSDLFIQMQSKYFDGGRYNTNINRREHSGRIYRATMKQVDLELDETPTKGP